MNKMIIREKNGSQHTFEAKMDYEKYIESCNVHIELKFSEHREYMRIVTLLFELDSLTLVTPMDVIFVDKFEYYRNKNTIVIRVLP